MKKRAKKQAKFGEERFFFEHSQTYGLRIIRELHTVRGWKRRTWSAKRLLSIFRQGVHDGWIK